MTHTSHPLTPLSVSSRSYNLENTHTRSALTTPTLYYSQTHPSVHKHLDSHNHFHTLPTAQLPHLFLSVHCLPTQPTAPIYQYSLLLIPFSVYLPCFFLPLPFLSTTPLLQHYDQIHTLKHNLIPHTSTHSHIRDQKRGDGV